MCVLMALLTQLHSELSAGLPQVLFFMDVNNLSSENRVGVFLSLSLSTMHDFTRVDCVGYFKVLVWVCHILAPPELSCSPDKHREKLL